uniref:Protein SSUH2 homolog n=1 Tax=Phallusia mammillata TaxID=59560 RepID=A0A6F9DT65_9ASCI|nr:protein SSUH2 homolog [Phallusia mammillata]
MSEKSGFQGISNPGYSSQQAPPYAPGPQQGAQYVPQQQGQYPAGPNQGGYMPQGVGQVGQQQQQPGVFYQGGQSPHQQYGAPGGQYPPQSQQAGAPPYGQASAPSAPVPWDPNTAPAYQGDMGQEVDENAATTEPQMSAPPSFESVVSGYENTNFNSDADIGPPPSYQQATGEAARVDAAKISTLTADDAQDALVAYVAQQCCYGSGAAKKMDIKDIQSTSALHYTLETFTESRSTKWHYVPYTGGFVDGPHVGPAPGPWDISCPFSSLFLTEVKKMEVPHTASVRNCHVCYGRGFNRCWKCLGRGRVRCSWCQGSGHRHEMRDGRSQRVHCHSCHGSGRKRCVTCVGTGCVRCRECQGYGKIKQFIQLTVKFTNRLSDHIVERTDMPDHLIRDVTGDVVFEQTAQRVAAIEGFNEQEINRRASEIVGAHATSWPNERILQQRQKLCSVPVYECRFKYSDKEGRFWVYGNQRAVFTTDYPHTCCCCTIL